MENTLLAILLEIIAAGNVKHEWKIAAIDRALTQLEQAKILLRLASDCSQITPDMYIARSEEYKQKGSGRRSYGL